jgi:hypothetical protein
LAVHPPDVEDWLRELKEKFELRNPTLGEIRKAMNNVYVHGQRQGFLPRTTDGNPIGPQPQPKRFGMLARSKQSYPRMS